MVFPTTTKKNTIMVTIMVFLAILLPQHSTMGFASVKSNLKNNTKTTHKSLSFLMAPLRIDQSMGLVTTKATTAGNDNGGVSSPPPPRGIILNASIGLVVFLGGLMGYVTKQSKASLIAGSTFGGAMGISSLLLVGQSRVGNYMGGIVSTLLSYVMGKKFLKSQKFMPSGFVSCMAILGMIYNLLEVLNTSNSSRKKPNDTIQEEE